MNQVWIKRIKRHICHWPNCGKQLRQSSHLKTHQDFGSQNKKFASSFCAKKFITKTIVNRDVKTLHLKNMPSKDRFASKMNGCERNYGSKHGLKYHQEIFHHKITPFESQYQRCNAKFGQKSRLKYHVLYHHLNEKPFKFNYKSCSFESVSQYDLNRHLNAVHLEIYQLKCTYNACEKKYKYKHSLKTHLTNSHLKNKNSHR